MKKLLFIILLTCSFMGHSQEIPYKSEWAFVNDNSNQNVSGFFDGKLDIVALGYDSRSLSEKWIVFEFPDHMEVELTKVVFTYKTLPTEIKSWFLDLNYNLVPAYTTNGVYEIPPSRVRAFITEWAYENPVEVKFYGSNHKPYVPFAPKRADVTFNNFCGAVTYPYDYQNAPESEDVKRAMLQATGINRIYIDKDWIYSGKYHFAPLYNKAWNLDYIFQMCNQYGIDIIPCLKGNEGGELYPELVEQFVIRYGNNKSVPLDKVKQFVGGDPWAYQEIKIGLGLINKIQLGNEPDRSWRGIYSEINPDGYLTPFQLAAKLAECYNRVKAIDPAIEVILSGLYNKKPGYIRGMLLWNKMFNGGRKFFDAISYHDYNSVDDLLLNPVFGEGLSPEKAGMKGRAGMMLKNIQEFGWEVKVYVTETGYSLSSVNPEKRVPVIEGKTRFQTQGDLILRSLLELSRAGLAGATPYELYQNGSNPGTFDTWMNWDLTCGIIDLDKKTPLPAWNYMYQAKRLIGNYKYESTLQNLPEIDQYDSAGVKRYVAWMPTSNNLTGTYSLSGNAFKTYDVNGISETKDVITVTETPIFFDKINLTPLPIKEKPGKGKGKPVKSTTLIYPNPTTSILNLDKQREYVLMDFQGIELKRGKSKNLPTSNLPNGLYILKLRNETTGYYEYLKFIKQ
jgi:endoglucanase